MTRAEQKLYLTSARFRRYFGNMDQQVSEPSRFLGEVPEKLVDEAGDRRRKPALKYEGTSYDTVDAVMKVLGGGAHGDYPSARDFAVKSQSAARSRIVSGQKDKVVKGGEKE